MPKENWKKAMYVAQQKKESRGIDIAKLVKEKGVKEAAVVPIGWLFEQLTKCLHNDQETMRIAAGPDGGIYIETFMDAEDIDGYTGLPGIDPPAWNNDWPRIVLP